MRNDSGFSLVEVLISIIVLSIMTASIFPFLIHVYEERITIRHESNALHVINENLQKWLYENQIPKGTAEADGVIYHWSVSFQNEDQIRMCLSWLGKNGRDYNKCGNAKK